MSETLQDHPVICIDTHFSNVPGFQSIDFDPHSYAAMLMGHSVPAEKAGSINNVYIRPDYDLAYSRWEKFKAFTSNPFDYTDAGSCVENDQGGVDIVLVYGSGYGINKLLRHETYHAIRMLTETDEGKLGMLARLRCALRARNRAKQEEAEADLMMKDKTLTSQYGKIINVSMQVS